MQNKRRKENIEQNKTLYRENRRNLLFALNSFGTSKRHCVKRRLLQGGTLTCGLSKLAVNASKNSQFSFCEFPFTLDLTKQPGNNSLRTAAVRGQYCPPNKPTPRCWKQKKNSNKKSHLVPVVLLLPHVVRQLCLSHRDTFMDFFKLFQTFFVICASLDNLCVLLVFFFKCSVLVPSYSFILPHLPCSRVVL